ncbi:MAG: LD-carboxypeptidase [Gammaproteobacteria bacterium]|nr:LD-carboxypeptidase [Gammaproteobacteria bacterium]
MDKLAVGDKVALIAPAARQVRGTEWMIEKAGEILEGWGLRVQMYGSPAERHFYLAGTDEQRARHLLDALREPDVRAVFVTRGGYGSPRLLPYLRESFSASDRYFCGFSDLTALLLTFEQRFPHICPIHAPAVATPAFCGDEPQSVLNRDRLQRVLFEQADAYQQPIEVIKSGSASGPLSGGCLSVLTGLLGTPFEPEFSDRILFLEDVNEKPFRIDRMLTQLKLAGKLQRLRGIVFGDMCACSDSQNDLHEVIADVLQGVDCPVVAGFSAGHARLNIAFRLGQQAVIDGVTKTFSLQA